MGLRLGVTPHKYCVCVEASSLVFTFHEYKQGQANFWGLFVFLVILLLVGWLLFCIVVLFCCYTLFSHFLISPCYIALLSHLFFHLVVLFCFFALLFHYVVTPCYCALWLHIIIAP
jgi:hypothetical protein